MRRRRSQPRRWVSALLAMWLLPVAGMCSLCEAACLGGAHPSSAYQGVGEEDDHCAKHERQASDDGCICSVLKPAATTRLESFGVDGGPALTPLDARISPLVVPFRRLDVGSSEWAVPGPQRNLPLRL
jgi:hypothetical protein